MDAETPYVELLPVSPTSEAQDMDVDIPVDSSAEAEASPLPEEATPVPRPDPAEEPRLDPAMETAPRLVPAMLPGAFSKSASPPRPRTGGISAPPHWPRWVQICMENRPKAPAPPPPSEANLSPRGRPSRRGRG